MTMAHATTEVLLICTSQPEFNRVAAAVAQIPTFVSQTPDVISGQEVVRFTMQNNSDRKVAFLLASFAGQLGELQGYIAQLTVTTHPAIIAMIGHCIADADRMCAGDVLIASSVWSSQADDSGGRDIQMVPQKSSWVNQANRFSRKYSLGENKAFNLSADAKVRVGDLATDSQLQNDETGIWFGKFQADKPQTLAVDREGIALPIVATNFGKHWLVVKTARSNGTGEDFPNDAAAVLSLLVTVDFIKHAFQTGLVTLASFATPSGGEPHAAWTTSDRPILTRFGLQLRQKLRSSFKTSEV